MFRVVMSRLCAVCNTNPHKYRCPKCRTVYCSVKCFKDHSCAVPTTAAQEPVTSAATHGAGFDTADANRRSEACFAEQQQAQFVQGALVRPDNIARLRSNPGVMNYLSDSRLQAVMREIDGARNREKALAHALETNPSFKQVIDAIVEAGGWIAE